MRIHTPRDANDVQVHIAGSLELEMKEPATFLDVKELKQAPSALRLNSVVFSLESGMTLYLWWDDKHGDTVILPLEGRGSLNFEPFGGIENPRREGWTGCVQFSTRFHDLQTTKSFFVGLEFAKIRE